MRSVLALSILLAAGCASDEPTGTFALTWTFADPDGIVVPTCASHELADVEVTARNWHSAGGTTVTATCSAGTLTTLPLLLGDYDLTIAAMGTRGDVAGKTMIVGRLSDDNEQETIERVTIEVRPPLTKLHTAWVLRKQGAASTCAALGNPVIQVNVTQDGAPIASKIWSCGTTDTTIDIPYGPFEVSGKMADAQQTLIATASEIPIPAARGTVTVDLSFDVVTP